MEIKSQDWLNFKKNVVAQLVAVADEAERFDFPLDDDGDFVVVVDGCRVLPVFTKKDKLTKVEYDFSLCNTNIRTLSFSTFLDATRIEVTLKKPISHG